MVSRSLLLTTLVASILICESAALSCLKCKDTDTDQTCSLGTGAATACTATDETMCYMRNNAGKIERGCMKDLEVAQQTACQLTGGQSCASCTGDSCNKDPWLKCHVCDGEAEACTKTQDATGAALCPLFTKADQCFAKVDGKKVTRGCQSNLLPTDDCATNKLCYLCTVNGCNSLSDDALKTFPKCLTCNSLDAKCDDGTATAAECPKQDDVCYSRVHEKALHRGCLSTLVEADQTKCKDAADATCQTCTDEDGCNKQSWLKCHQCKQTDVATCAEVQTVDKAEFCPAYKDGNHCYERLETGNVVRGCETDLPKAESPCKDNRECRVCTEDACNKEAAATLQNQDRCLQCSTSVDAEKSCLLGTEASQPCAKVSEKKCYSKTDSDGVLKRGCQGDLTANEVTACTGKTCAICENEGCNNAVFPTDRLRCYQCKTTEADKSCSEQLTGVPKSSYCTLYKDGDQCYSRISGGVFERGCQSTLKAAACEGLTAKECQVCATENCNSVSETRLKNSAGQKAISSVLVAAVVALVLFK